MCRRIGILHPTHPLAPSSFGRKVFWLLSRGRELHKRDKNIVCASLGDKARPGVPTLEQGWSVFLPSQRQHPQQTSPLPSPTLGTRLSKLKSLPTELTPIPSLLGECQYCFPGLRLLYLEEGGFALSSTACPRKHDITLEQKRES